MSEPFVRTGVFATDEEVESLKATMKQPYIVVGGVPPEDPRDHAHRVARGHDLPEIPGRYGVDLQTGEFVAPLGQYPPPEQS